MAGQTRVVVVDDEVLIAEYIAGELEDAGYQVCEVCRTYEDALEAVSRHDPDLVILDISIGRSGNGLDLARDIMVRKPTKVIFCSGMQPSDAGPEFARCGLLMKPFTPADLMRVVDRTLAVA
jgi:DNA-binding response OmpR family regulator